jgi:hypothetical protein
MKGKYKIRFNLGKGKNFMNWKISYPTGAVRYYEPSEVVLKMKGCTLKNQKGGAKKIFDGANKFVVAWVEADDVTVLKQTQLQMGFDKVSYNPRVTPNWVMNGQDVDGCQFEAMVSINKELFLQ